ncbi:MAG: LysM peptidoglycan-binding domain-containing protein [Bacteroidales bacterium]|nr:LysM peptidoglycan-binding domain-containing protein [Bacteroidales bacterium]MDY6426777.1 LysM peptidoglycan-binding domain-containing protein [Bacteroidales bacterium]
MRRIILTMVSALTATLCVYAAATLNYPTIVENGKEYYIYKVQKSEGYYAISKKFDVTIKEIVDANPMQGGLKLGQELKIPTGNVVKVERNPDHSRSKSLVHVVEKGETLYSLAKKYGVKVDDLKKLNPGCDPLSIGFELKIPSDIKKHERTHADEKQKQAEAEPQNVTPMEAMTETPLETSAAESLATDSIPQEIFHKNPQSDVRMAVLMPFNIHDNNEADEKFVDFYRGCLIAADSLSALGMNVTIDAYDIGKTKESLIKTLQNRELSKADIIIGPAYTAQIQYVSDYARHHKIKTVIPFSNNVPQVNSNKYLFQIVSPQNLFFESLATECAERWKGKHILIVEPDSAGIRYNKREFTDLLIPKLSAKGITYKYITDTKVAGQVNNYISEIGNDDEVIVIIPTSNHVKITQIADHIEQIKSDKVSLFGFPEWNEMMHKDIYNKPMYMFTNYWLRFDDPATIDFYNQYNSRFGTPPAQNNPSYSIFGFDITLFFGKAWMHSGDEFEGFLNDEHQDMLQMRFHFDKRPNGGYVNHGLYLQRYDKEGISLMENR